MRNQFVITRRHIVGTGIALAGLAAAQPAAAKLFPTPRQTSGP